ncbi:MAG: MlaD family protein [Bacteroidota bacterium]
MMRYLNLSVLLVLATLLAACTSDKTYQLMTDDARGIEAGDEVYRQGISVGEVEAVEFAGDMVKIDITIDEPLYEGQGFEITRDGKERQLELDRPDRGANALADGATVIEGDFGRDLARSLDGLGEGLEGLGEGLSEALSNVFEGDGENLEESLERIANRWETAGEGLGEAIEEWAEEHEEELEELEVKLERWANEHEEDFEKFGEEVEAWAEDFEGNMEDFVLEMERISDRHEVGSRAWKREMRKVLEDLKD